MKKMPVIEDEAEMRRNITTILRLGKFQMVANAVILNALRSRLTRE